MLAILTITGMAVPTAAAAAAAAPAVARPASAPAPNVLLQQVEGGVVNDSLRLRRELGFEATESKLAEILRGPEGLTPSVGIREEGLVNEWGFIGTAAEASEMKRRDALVSAVEPVVREFSQQEKFAGHFLDNRRDGRLVVQFAGALPTPDRQDALMKSALNSGSTVSDVEFRVVEHSTAELTGAMEAVWKWAAKAGGTDIPVISVEEDVTTNGLKVVLRPGSEQAGVRDVLARLDIPAIITEGDGADEACTSRNACDSPRRGGVGISKSNSLCSIGWVVNRSGVRGALTAGHCWWGTNSGSVASGSATYGSLTGTNALTNGTHADMRFISIPSGGQPWLYQNAANKARVVTGSSLGSVGSTACLFGRNSENARCGTISSTNASHTSSTCGCVVYGQSAASYSSAGGDSGGAVASSSTGNVARGVHSGSFGGAKHYSWIGYTSTYNMGTLATG
ncbi:S1 family peptidase [Streptomyces virginiae]|uniref:S1 family peptidase n=1 Tax=Streptomyces virginiae TaxID=1961 RepID=UPI0036848432